MTDSWTAQWNLAQTTGAPQAATGAGAKMAGMPQGVDAPASATTGTVQPAPGAAPAGGSSPQGLGPLIWLLPVMMLVMIGMSVLTGRKDKKKRAELLSALKRNDQVQTHSGIVGTVAEIGDDSVVLRIEDGRIRVVKSAIAGIIGPGARPGVTSVETKPEAKATV